MSSKYWSRASRGLFLAAAFAVALPAGAVTFYKWTDSDGKVHYGDTPPKAYAATAKRVEVDTTAVPAPPSRPLPDRVTREPARQPPAVDLLTQRRLTRERLEKSLEDARERLDLAKKALAETTGPQEGELQVAQGQPLPAGSNVPPPQVGGNSNCRQIATPQGSRVFCPHLVPNEQYYERLDKMQEDVRLAEEAVEAAERAYRRGVD